MAYFTAPQADTYFGAMSTKPGGWDDLTADEKLVFLEMATHRFDALPWLEDYDTPAERIASPPIVAAWYEYVQYLVERDGRTSTALGDTEEPDELNALADLPANVAARLVPYLNATGITLPVGGVRGGETAADAALKQAQAQWFTARAGTELTETEQAQQRPMRAMAFEDGGGVMGGLTEAEVMALIQSALEDLPPGGGLTEAQVRTLIRANVKDFAEAGGASVALGDTDFADDVEDAIDIDRTTWDTGTRTLTLTATDGTTKALVIPAGAASSGLTEAEVNARINAEIPANRRVPATAAGDRGEFLGVRTGSGSTDPAFIPVPKQIGHVEGRTSGGSTVDVLNADHLEFQGAGVSVADGGGGHAMVTIPGATGTGVSSATAGAGLTESGGVLNVNPGQGIAIAGDKVGINLDTRRPTAAFTLDETNGLDLASRGVVRDRIANDAIDESKLDPAVVAKLDAEPLVAGGVQFNAIQLSLNRVNVATDLFSARTPLAPVADLDLMPYSGDGEFHVVARMTVTRTSGSDNNLGFVRNKANQYDNDQDRTTSVSAILFAQDLRDADAWANTSNPNGLEISRTTLYSLNTDLGDVVLRLVKDSNDVVGVVAWFDTEGVGTATQRVDITLRASWFQDSPSASTGGGSAQAEEILLDHDYATPLVLSRNSGTQLAIGQAFNRALTESEDGETLLIQIATTPATTEDDFPTPQEFAIRAGDWRTLTSKALTHDRGSYRWTFYLGDTDEITTQRAILLDKGPQGRLMFQAPVGGNLSSIRVRKAAGLRGAKGDKGDPGTGSGDATAQASPHVTFFDDVDITLRGTNLRAGSQSPVSLLSPVADLDLPPYSGRGEYSISVDLTYASTAGQPVVVDNPRPTTFGFVPGKSNQTDDDRTITRSEIVFASALQEAGQWASQATPNGVPMVFGLYSGVSTGILNVRLVRNADNRVGVVLDWVAGMPGAYGPFSFTATIRVAFTPSDAAAGGEQSEEVLLTADLNPPVLLPSTGNGYQMAQTFGRPLAETDDGGVMLVELSLATTSGEDDFPTTVEFVIRTTDWRTRASQALNRGKESYRWGMAVADTSGAQLVTAVFIDKGPQGRLMLKAGGGNRYISSVRVRLPAAGRQGPQGPAGVNGRNANWQLLTQAAYDAITAKAADTVYFVAG